MLHDKSFYVKGLRILPVPLYFSLSLAPFGHQESSVKEKNGAVKDSRETDPEYIRNKKY
jgi:hypothetical protein